MTVFHISRKDVGENIYDFRVDKDFLERKVKALTSKQTKINHWMIKMKAFF